MHWSFTVLAAEQGLSLWQELWQYFYETYFTDETVYEHLNMGGGSLISVRNIIFGLFFGLVVAGFAVVFNKRVPGGFVRLLLKEACLSPETGRTLPELNSAHKLYIRYAVRRSVSLRRVVKCREEEDYLAEEAAEEEAYAKRREEDPSLPKHRRVKPFRIDPDRHHFYIPEEMKYTAEIKFEKKGTTWWGAVCFAVIMLIVFVLVLVALPQILEVLNDFVGSIGADNAADAI
ncbi:MAG: hypothetical protein E7668_01505 [Ruminococcaceae bacterium]|nr:hypothetical protein [Oscillospiraceae bacterium]